MTDMPAWLSSEEGVDDFLSTPTQETIDFLRTLPSGDVALLGVGGKMGPTLGMMLIKAVHESGVSRKIYGISRFSEAGLAQRLTDAGLEVIACDLADHDKVMSLPDVKYLIYMAGRKFGDVGSEPLTWVMNVAVPYNVISRFKDSTIVAFSTGCVYPLASPDGGGSTEADGPAPVGEYANSCLGRERIFEYAANRKGGNVQVLNYRLNYAIDVRYGVLSDIAANIIAGRPVDLTVSHFNCVWQGEANNYAIQCLGLAASPAVALNITGTKTVSVRECAEKIAAILGKPVTFTGTPGKGMYLADAARAAQHFGEPTVGVDEMIRWIGGWLKAGGRSLNKPTHFTVTDGQFLD